MYYSTATCIITGHRAMLLVFLYTHIGRHGLVWLFFVTTGCPGLYMDVNGYILSHICYKISPNHVK